MEANRYRAPLTMSMFRNAADLVGEALAQREAAADLIDQLDFERTALRAERDELLEAVKEYVRAMEGFAEAVRADTRTPYPWEPQDYALPLVRAAIAKAEGRA